MRYILSFVLLSLCLVIKLQAQQLVEAPVPIAFVTDKNGEEQTLQDGEAYTGEAPLDIKFTANAEQYDEYICVTTWRFIRVDDSQEFLTRYDQDVTYTFKEAGVFNIQLFVTYTSRSDPNLVLEYEYDPFVITISESSLKVPNAFSPNGDGINDFFNVFDVKSIVSFSGSIYNRWGQQLFTWGIDQIGCTDCGWDGTYKGKPVKDGVYYVVIVACGADGINYNIKSDVNILRGFTEKSGGQ